jgi:50S ribosomal subunit-associated GTPase HflX
MQVLIPQYHDIVSTIQAQLEYWLQEVKSLRTSASPIIIVGTHSDQTTDEQLAVVSQAAAHRFPKHRFPDFQGTYFVSCKTGEGITELQRKLEEMAEQLGSRSIPASWVQLHDFFCRKFGDEDDADQPSTATMV